MCPSEHRAGVPTTQHLAAIVYVSSNAIIGMAFDGIITSWNPGAARIYGYTADEMIGQSISVPIPARRRGELA